MITGIDLGPDDIATEGISENGSNTPKYFKMEYNKDYYIRLVSGILPYYSHYFPNKPSLISPKTLHMVQGTTTSDEKQYIYHKEDGSFYTKEEASDPYIDGVLDPPKLQKRYGTNIIDVNEVRNNPEGPYNFYILSGGKMMFEHFLRFKDQFRNYPCFDPDRGVVWRICKTKADNRTSYFVEMRQDIEVLPGLGTSLPPGLRAQTEMEKKAPGDLGVWNLLEEFHPFKCSLKNAIDNGHNPLFFPENQKQQMPNSVPQPPSPTLSTTPAPFPQAPQQFNVPPVVQQFAAQTPPQQQFAQPQAPQMPQQVVVPPQMPFVPQQPMAQPQQFVQSPSAAVQTIQAAPISAMVSPQQQPVLVAAPPFQPQATQAPINWGEKLSALDD